MLKLNKEEVQVLLSIGMTEHKGDFPAAAAEAVYALSTQTGDSNKEGG